MTGTKKDVVTGLTLALAMASMAMTVADRMTGSAKSAEQLEGRVATLERVQGEHGAVIRVRGRFVNDATNQLNFLCATDKTCRQLYAPIAAPE